MAPFFAAPGHELNELLAAVFVARLTLCDPSGCTSRGGLDVTSLIKVYSESYGGGAKAPRQFEPLRFVRLL
jgi:hypothetical protein